MPVQGAPANKGGGGDYNTGFKDGQAAASKGGDKGVSAGGSCKSGQCGGAKSGDPLAMKPQGGNSNGISGGGNTVGVG